MTHPEPTPYTDPAAAPNEPFEDEISLLDYLAVLMRRRWIVMGVFCLTVLAVGVITWRATPIYKASTTLMLSESNSQSSDALFAELTGLPTKSEIPSQMEVIKSRTIAEAVVRELKYDHKIYDVSPGLAPLVADLEIPPPSPGDDHPSVYRVNFTDAAGGFTVSRNGDAPWWQAAVGRFFPDALAHAEPVGSGRLGRLFEGPDGLRFRITQAAASPGASFKLTRAPFQQAVRHLKGQLTIDNVRNTNVVTISVMHPDRSLAADLANSVVRHYIRKDIASRSQESTNIIDFIQQQLTPSQEKLDAALAALAAHKADSRVVDLQEGTRSIIETISALEKSRTALSVKQRQVLNLHEALRRNGKDIATLTISVLEDPNVEDMIHRLLTLDSRRTNLLTDFTAKHPEVVALSREIQHVKAKVLPAVGHIRDSIASRMQSLTEKIDSLNADLKQIPAEEQELAGLVLNKEVLTNINTFLIQKINEASIAKASTISAIQVIDPAIPPHSPEKPDKKRNMLLALVVGLMGGIGLAFFVDYLDNSFRSPQDVEDHTGLPAFARIPMVSKSTERYLVTIEKPRSIESESYRSLRTGLQFTGLESDRGQGRVVLITSSQAGEGKTTVTANLAVTLGQAGHSTLMLELDLRKPTMRKIFPGIVEMGITNTLSQNTSLKEVIVPSGQPNLDLIPAGIIPPNPSELLTVGHLAKVIEALRKRYAYILIDSPPVLPVSDALVLSRHADTLFLVVELHRTPRQAVKQALKQIAAAGVRVTGGVVNKVPAPGRYGYYKYGYHSYQYYSTYYGEERKQKRKNHRKA